MLDFSFHTDESGDERWLETSLYGKALLTIPQLNKGTAFSQQERVDFQLLGKLPNRIETLDEQVRRAYQQFSAYDSNLKRNIYLNNLHDKNQILFYKLVSEHMTEMMPTIYTPIVGTAVKQYSHEFRQPRGLYISYPDMDHLEQILDCRSNPDIDLIVVTDGEGVLGIGDQGIGAMDIPIAKLMVYSLCGGINPCKTLPICIDVGTNNQTLLDDPMYLGWRHPRLTGKDYDEFIDRLIRVLTKKFPHLFLHWEDFGRSNARRLLDQYRGSICTFNDDIQGTGAVALAAILAACKVTDIPLADHRIVIFGAGTAGTGIADQIYDAMTQFNQIPPETARECFYLIDRDGLLNENMDDLTSAQQPYARSMADIAAFTENKGVVDLESVVKQVKPTILIGCSAVGSAFSESVISEMAKHCDKPIIFPLSNPTERAEATPDDLMKWTHGNALIATGSPFPDVEIGDEVHPIAQCNNALVFPGIGLGIIAVKANQLSDKMIWAATQALSECSPKLSNPQGQLLPRLKDSQEVAKKIAVAVATEAIEEGASTIELLDSVEETIEKLFWQPHYLPYRFSGT